MTAIKLADFLTKCVDEESSKFSSDDPFFIQAADKLRRLSAIEQAATALIKCRGRYHAELNTKALAEALGLAIHSQLLNTPFMIRTAPEVIWLQVSDNPHESALPFPANHADVTWCSESVMPSEVQYVRADLMASDRPAGSSAEDLLVRALAALEYHTQQTRPIVESGNVIAALVEYLTNQCAEQAEDPGRPSVIELPQASSEEPEPVAWRVYCPTWGGDGYGIWNNYNKDDSELAYYLGRPECRIEYAAAFDQPKLDDIDVVELNRPTAIELQAAEVGIPEPVTELINPSKGVSQS